MPQKLNKAGKMQDYIPKGNGDASGEYGTSNGTNKNFTTSDKKKETKANVITENKSVVVENKGKTKLSYVDDVLKKLPKDLDDDELDEAIKDELNDSVWYEDNNSENITEKEFNEMVKEIKNKYGKNKKDVITKNKSEVVEDKKEKGFFRAYNSDGSIADEKKIPVLKLSGKMKEISMDNKANIIDDDLTGKKDIVKDSYNRNYEIVKGDKIPDGYSIWNASVNLNKDGKWYLPLYQPSKEEKYRINADTLKAIEVSKEEYDFIMKHTSGGRNPKEIERALKSKDNWIRKHAESIKPYAEKLFGVKFED